MLAEVTTNGVGTTVTPPPHLTEHAQGKIREALRLRHCLEQRIAELTQMERQAELQLYGIRAALGEMQAQLEQAKE